MVFTWIDAVALALLAIMFIRGWSAGFVVMAGNLVSLVLGVGVTAYLFTWVSGWAGVTNWHIAHPILALVIFLLALGIVVKLLRILVKLANAMFKIVSIIPFVGSVNHLLGAALGVIEAAVVAIVFVWVVQNIGYELLPNGWEGGLTDSYTFNVIGHLVDAVLPMMPIAI